MKLMSTIHPLEWLIKVFWHWDKFLIGKQANMNGKPLNFFGNIDHLYDYFPLLNFATAAALSLAGRWDISYAELIPYVTLGIYCFWRLFDSG